MATSALDQLTTQVRTAVTSLGGKRLAVIAAVFVAVVAGIGGIAYWASQPTWALLATDVEPEAMSGVVDRLKALKVDYELDPGGRTIRVDASRVDELRMKLAAEGLPASGRIGFELFDRTMFGATEMTEKVNFQRALEGELARTISSLSTVSAARVHLALPRNSLFAHESEPAKASVVLRLKTGRLMAAADVEGIVALVSSSVEGLDPAAVTVIDATGRRISTQIDTSESATDRGRYDRQQQLEKDMAARVVALLEPVVGPGRVRANVSALLKTDSEEETEERWDPNSVIRSRQQTTEADGRPVAQGAAGAKANMPVDAKDKEKAAAAQTPASSYSTNNRSSETTNYELSRLTRHKISPAGQLSRLSVAVLIDDVKTSKTDDKGQLVTTSTPRGKDELQRLHTLVASAVGLNPDRGDQLTVDNIAFDVPDAGPLTEAPAPLTPWQIVADQLQTKWRTAVPIGGIAVLVLGAMAYVWRLRRRKSAALAPQLARLGAAASGAAVAAMPRAATASAAVEEPAQAPLPSPARQLARLAQAEPEQLARIVRGWLAEEER